MNTNNLLIHGLLDILQKIRTLDQETKVRMLELETKRKEQPMKKYDVYITPPNGTKKRCAILEHLTIALGLAMQQPYPTEIYYHDESGAEPKACNKLWDSEDKS